MFCDDKLLLYQENNYTIYQCSNEVMGYYFLCLPNNLVDTYQLYVGFSKKDLSNTSKNILLRDIRSIYDVIYKSNKSAIYVIPNIDMKEMKEASMENDDKLYKSLYKKVSSMTMSVNKFITKYKGKKIDQVIKMIKQDDDDMKFVDWLEINMPKFIRGINLKRKSIFNELDPFEDVYVISKDSSIDASVVKHEGTKVDMDADVKVYVPKKKTKNKSSGFSSLSFLIMIVGILVLFSIVLFS